MIVCRISPRINAFFVKKEITKVLETYLSSQVPCVVFLKLKSTQVSSDPEIKVNRYKSHNFPISLERRDVSATVNKVTSEIDLI